MKLIGNYDGLLVILTNVKKIYKKILLHSYHI